MQRKARSSAPTTDCRFGRDLTGKCCSRFHKSSLYGRQILRVPFESPLTSLLGTGRTGDEAQWEVPVAAENRCVSHGEEAEFRQQCGSVIRYMDVALGALRYRRGLVIRLTSDDPKWGWGHVLTAAFAWHFVCARLHRFCYMQLFDSQFDQLFGYANGESWEPTRDELSQYTGTTLHLRNRSTNDAHHIPRLLQDLKLHDSHSLIVLDLDGWPPLDSHNWLPYALPLRFDRRAQFTSADAEALRKCLQLCEARTVALLASKGKGGGRGACLRRCLEQRADHVTSRLDRCFARFVTQPLFSPSQFHKSMASLPVAYHLRTGWADVTDAALRGTHLQSTCCPNLWQCADTRTPRVPQCITAPATLGHWFHRACNTTRFASQKSWVMTDNPFLLQYLHSTHGAQVHSNYEEVPRLPRMTAAARRARDLEPGYRGMVNSGVLDLTTTRIWKNSPWGAKREAALDAYVAGLLPEIQISPHTSFARPIVARSMCTRRVVHLTRDGVCPEWDAEFHRDMWGLSGTVAWPCVEESLPAAHGCKGLAHSLEGGQTCRRYYVSSMLTAYP